MPVETQGYYQISPRIALASYLVCFGEGSAFQGQNYRLTLYLPDISYVGSGDPNSSPLAYEIKVLTSEPSPQPRKIFFN